MGETKDGKLFAESAVEVEGGADECEMGKGLGEISQGFAMVARFFGV